MGCASGTRPCAALLQVGRTRDPARVQLRGIIKPTHKAIFCEADKGLYLFVKVERVRNSV